MLFVRALIDKVRAKEDIEAFNEVIVIAITCLVGIKEGMKSSRRTFSKMKTIMRSIYQVT